ncbi:MAG: hypothetical protein LUB83_00275 [Prevotellaceae bacterium]|nr:hypothetical protein [Prevotellaceae bacterium]
MQIKYHAIYIAVVCGLSLQALLCACDGQEETAGVTGEHRLTLRFTSSKAGTPTRAADALYEEGTDYENRIDFEGEDYRIYFFTAGAADQKRNTLIARFIPEQVSAWGSGGSERYSVTGKVPESLLSCSAFKVVMLANWGNYADGEFIAGKTTVDDISTAEWARYDAFPTGESSSTGGSRLIPFYGVCDYTGVRFDSGEVTALQGDLTLLRAVAKVEVVLDSTLATFSDVSVCNYNGQGFCAPYGIYTKGQYDPADSSFAGTAGFVEGLHLVGGKNDATGKRHSFKCVRQRSDSEMETWLAYLPEYDNSGNDYCYIEVRFDYQTAADEPYKIYFADYADGTTDAYVNAAGGSARHDILRNNLYRFMVTLRDRIPAVDVDLWENSYDNEFDYIRVVED